MSLDQRQPGLTGAAISPGVVSDGYGCLACYRASASVGLQGGPCIVPPTHSQEELLPLVRDIF